MRQVLEDWKPTVERATVALRELSDEESRWPPSADEADGVRSR
jgi:hypothetical protein